MSNIGSIVTEDRVAVNLGDVVFNYYDRQIGYIGSEPDASGWFDFHPLWVEAGAWAPRIKSLNGERVCSLLYARSQGWVTPAQYANAEAIARCDECGGRHAHAHPDPVDPIAPAADLNDVVIHGRAGLPEMRLAWDAIDGHHYMASYWEDENEECYLRVVDHHFDQDRDDIDTRKWKLPADTNLLRLVADGWRG